MQLPIHWVMSNSHLPPQAQGWRSRCPSPGEGRGGPPSHPPVGQGTQPGPLPGAPCLVGPASPPGAAWFAGIPNFAASCPLPLSTLPARPCGQEDYFNEGRVLGKSAMRKGRRLLALPSTGALATCPSTLLLMDMDFVCPA